MVSIVTSAEIPCSPVQREAADLIPPLSGASASQAWREAQAFLMDSAAAMGGLTFLVYSCHGSECKNKPFFVWF